MATQSPTPAGGPPRVYATRDAADAFVRRLLDAHGVPAEDAAIIAHCLVRADLRGVDTHGIVRLPGYLDRVRKKLTNTSPKLVVEKKTPVAGLLDGQNAFGFLVGTKAMQEAIAMARDYGIGMVAAKHSNHFGMAASYVLQALEAGFIGVVFSNASPAMPPWGGKDAFLGTSPFAAGAPGGKLPAILLDMAPSVVARGKIRRAERLKQTIPLGYALDAKGRPTTDPTAALGGVVLPIGGYKGSGLAVLMDIFGGVFSGVRTTFTPDAGPLSLLYAFEAVVIGGLGSLWGTFAGAVILGVAQSVGAKVDAGMGILFGHLVFLAVLLFKPNGLFAGSKL